MHIENTFPEWQERLDRLLSQEVGCLSSDLKTFKGRELFDSGASPEQAADIALAYGLGDWLTF